MRTATLGVIALLIVAGCLSAAANTESAQSLESTAADRQEDRAEDGELVALWGVEPPRHIEEEQVTVDIYLDDETFDGETAGWAYAYLGQDKGGIVVVGDTVGVLGEAWYTFEGNESQEAHDEVDPIEGWNVDSEEVADTLADDERWPEMSPSWATTWQLRQTDDGPVWRVEATNVTIHGTGTTVTAAVSASNGTILSIEEHDDHGYGPSFDDDPDPDREREGGCSSSSTSGQVTPASGVGTDVDLPEDGWISFRVQASGAGPLDLTVLEDGDEEVWSDSMLVTGSDTVTATVEDLDDGEYRVEATTDAGAIEVQMVTHAGWGAARDCGSHDAWGTGSAYPIDARPASELRILDPTLGLASLTAGAWQTGAAPR